MQIFCNLEHAKQSMFDNTFRSRFVESRGSGWAGWTFSSPLRNLKLVISGEKLMIDILLTGWTLNKLAEKATYAC